MHSQHPDAEYSSHSVVQADHGPAPTFGTRCPFCDGRVEFILHPAGYAIFGTRCGHLCGLHTIDPYPLKLMMHFSDRRIDDHRKGIA